MPTIKRGLYPAILSTFLILISFKIKDAYFFSDDYTWFQNLNLEYVLEPYMGHYMYSIKLIYVPLYYLFGINTYFPYLFSSLLCMAIASYGVYRFLLQLNLGYIISCFAALLILIVPNSEHTVFFLQAAAQLLTFSSIFYVFTFKPRFKFAKILIVTIWLAGAGGYGLPILMSLSLYFLLERQIRYLLITIPTLLILIVNYISLDSKQTEIPKLIDLLNYIVTSYWLTLTNSFGILFSVILVIVQIYMVVSAVFKKNYSALKYPLILYVSLFSFYSLIFVARLGVENILAARYIALSNLFVVTNLILATIYVIKFRFLADLGVNRTVSIILILLVIGFFHNSMGFYRVLQNIEWGSKITLGQVSAVYCSQSDNSNNDKWQTNNSLRSLDYGKFLAAFKGRGTPLKEKAFLQKLGEPAVSSYQDMLTAMNVSTSSKCFITLK